MNTSGNRFEKSATAYILINIAQLLSTVMLHREYLPFIPVGLDKPRGPIDEPTFPPEEFPLTVNPNYWEDSARRCFQAARDILDLASQCKEWKILPETPLVAFAAWQTAFVGKLFS